MEEDCHLPNHDTCRYSAELQVKSLVVWLIGKQSPSLPPCFRKQGTPSSQQALSRTVILSPVEPNWKYYSYLMSYRHIKRSMYKTKRSTCPSWVFSISVNRRQLYSCPKPWNHFLYPKCLLEWFLTRFMVLLVFFVLKEYPPVSLAFSCCGLSTQWSSRHTLLSVHGRRQRFYSILGTSRPWSRSWGSAPGTCVSSSLLERDGEGGP